MKAKYFILLILLVTTSSAILNAVAPQQVASSHQHQETFDQSFITSEQWSIGELELKEDVRTQTTVSSSIKKSSSARHGAECSFKALLNQIIKDAVASQGKNSYIDFIYPFHNFW